MAFKVGKGDSVLFLKHVWCCETPLEIALPLIFHLAGKKDSTINHHFTHSGALVTWQLYLRRNLNDWEIGEVVVLLQILENVRININIENQRVRQGDPSGEFSISSCYKVLNMSLLNTLQSFCGNLRFPQRWLSFFGFFFMGRPLF